MEQVQVHGKEQGHGMVQVQVKHKVQECGREQGWVKDKENMEQGLGSRVVSGIVAWYGSYEACVAYEPYDEAGVEHTWA